MEKVCKKHQINPARIYGQCIGCELDLLRNSVEVAKLHLQNENLERLRAERDRNEARQANAALLEGIQFYGNPHNYAVPFNGTFRSGNPVIENDGGKFARNLLTQYDTAPKEDKTNE